MIITEFFSESKENNIGFCHWRKKEYYPIGISENFPKKLNYFSIKPDNYRNYISPDFFFKKNRYNSFALQLTPTLIDELKITNIKITDWDDIWQDKKGNIIDPRIEKLDLSHNLLKNLSILDERKDLKELNISFNSPLVYLNVSNAPKLKKINISYCYSIEYINLSSSTELEDISINGCNCSEQCLESLLRNIKPKRVGRLDLRGNKINWGNRNISSKIRLLLANNWKILWDSNPPDSIIPLGYWKKFDPYLLDRNFK